jgi:hypothetical protein
MSSEVYLQFRVSRHFGGCRTATTSITGTSGRFYPLTYRDRRTGVLRPCSVAKPRPEPELRCMIFEQNVPKGEICGEVVHQKAGTKWTAKGRGGGFNRGIRFVIVDSPSMGEKGLFAPKLMVQSTLEVGDSWDVTFGSLFS